MYQYTTKDLARFWSKVNKDGNIPLHCPELGNCWEWRNGMTRKRYGHFAAGGRKGKQFQSHHVSWELAFGDVPNGLWVLHKCDNPCCVRPDHLFLGTQKDNMKDMHQKKRRISPDFSGENNPRHKLTKIQVDEIRQRYENGETNKSVLGREYGVHNTQISRIIRKKLWL